MGIGLDSRDETAQVDGGQYGHRRQQHGGDGVDQIAEIVDAARCDVLDDRVGRGAGYVVAHRTRVQRRLGIVIAGRCGYRLIVHHRSCAD